MDAPGPSRRRRRSPERSSTPSVSKKKACQYCFRRKMKCDLVSPTCTNCQTHGEECVPVTRASRPRPTHEQIDTVAAENTRLRDFLRHLASLPPDGAAVALEQWTQGDTTGGGGDVPSMPSRAVNRSASPARRVAEQDFPYQSDVVGHVHGPTSALFQTSERDLAESNTPQEAPATTVAETELIETATQRCAEERHMEMINLAAGKLDFDGVQPDLAIHLLALHWNRQHFGFMVSYRPLFTRDMACAGPYFSKLLLNAIFFSVSKFSNRPEVYDNLLDQGSAGNQFLCRVKELLGDALDQSSIPTIQAMLLLSNSVFALGRQSSAWLYAGVAVQMIFDLVWAGSLSADDFEIRRRIVWSAFIIDKIISLYQGRPVSFDEDRMHVPHRFLDWYEEEELWMPFAFSANKHYPGTAARAVSTFTALCSLSVIMGRIITQIYAERVVSDPPADVLPRLSSSLTRWRASLPPEIQFDVANPPSKTPPPHVLSLHMVFYTLVTLLHRPFVENGHHRRSDPNIVELSWARCEEAARGATTLLSLYRSTFTLARAPYLISYTTFVAATIHVRIAAQRGIQSEAARLLLVCLDGLRENAATNPGVKKMYTTVSGLMERLNVDLPSPSTIEVPAVIPVDAVLSDDALDLEAIISSFGMTMDDLGVYTSVAGDGADPNANAQVQQPQDVLYGFLGLPSV